MLRFAGGLRFPVDLPGGLPRWVDGGRPHVPAGLTDRVAVDPVWSGWRLVDGSARGPPRGQE